MRSVFLLPFALVASASACSLLTSFDDLSGGQVTAEAGADSNGEAGADTGGADAGDDASGNDDAAGALNCADAGVFLCEDFEGPIDLQKWPIREAYEGTVTLDPTRSHRGTSSLHVHTDPNDAGGDSIAQLTHLAAFPDEYFIRSFVFQPSPITAGSHDYVNLAQDQTDTSASVDFTDENDFLHLTVRTPAFSDTGSMNPFPLGKWACVELHIKNGPAGDGGVGTGHMQVFQEGVSLAEMDVDVPTFPINVVRFGLNEPEGSDLWIDDIVIDTTRVGCAK
jgi:hypothetical protein